MQVGKHFCETPWRCSVPLMKSMKWLLACLWQTWCYLGSSEYGSLPSPRTDSLFCSSSGIPHCRTTHCSKLGISGLLRSWFSAGYCSPGSGFTEVLLDTTPPGEQRGAGTFGRVWRKQDGCWFLETTAQAVPQQPRGYEVQGTVERRSDWPRKHSRLVCTRNLTAIPPPLCCIVELVNTLSNHSN